MHELEIEASPSRLKISTIVDYLERPSLKDFKWSRLSKKTFFKSFSIYKNKLGAYFINTLAVKGFIWVQLELNIFDSINKLL